MPRSGAARSSTRAFVVWAVYALVIVVIKLGDDAESGNVYRIYADATQRWFSGDDLYGPPSFIYFPTAAVLFSPLAVLPPLLGGAVWRILNLAVFAVGIQRLGRSMDEGRPTHSFLIASLTAMVLCTSAAKHGQMTLVMAGLLMLAAVALEREAPWRAALCTTLAVALKPLAVPFLLAAVVAYPAVRWRAGLCLLAFALLSFALQEPEYVLRQYEAVPRMLRTAAAREDMRTFPHVFGLLHTTGLDVTGAARTVVRIVFALATLWLCVHARARLPKREVSLFLYALTTCYLLLFNPGTERNTYAMMVPVVGLVGATAWVQGRRGISLTMAGMVVAFLLSHRLSSGSPDTVLSMLKPISCIVLTVLLVRHVLEQRRPRDGPLLADESG